MGRLSAFDLDSMVADFKLENMLETGTYQGESISYALKSSFQRIISIEISEHWYQNAKNLFADEDRVTLYHGDCIDILKNIDTIIDGGATLFWLDAHFAQEHFFHEGKEGYGILHNESLSAKSPLPLEEELTILQQKRDLRRDVFIMDDLRVYEKLAFSHGNWNEHDNPRFHPYTQQGIAFVNAILGDTHQFKRDLRDEGYYIAYPK